jgi:hydroxymethylglutaryl-CoA lyase
MTIPPLPATVSIREMGLRDGLQSISHIMPTAQKLEWIRGAWEAGQREIEVGSFVPAKLLPQLADTAELVAYGKTLPGLTVSVLVPNMKGAERAMETGAHSMLLPLSASHAHSLANMRRTPDEVVADIGKIRAARDASGSATKIEIGISTAWGCTIQGEVPHAEVVRLVNAVLDVGVDAVALADTVGYADPAMVQDLLDKVLPHTRDKMRGAHFHDTRGLGLANCFAALQMGMRQLDASLAGIGGCPHAPGASGNVNAEDLAFMLGSMGIETGIDFNQLMALRNRVAQWLPDQPLQGTLWRAGLPKTMTTENSRSG